MGFLSAAFASGFIFGTAFGGFLGSFGFMAPFIGAAIATLGTFLITSFMLEESLSEEQRSVSRIKKGNNLPVGQLLKIRPLLLIALIGFLGTLAYAAIPPTFALYADQIVFADIAARSRVPFYIGLMLSFMGAVAVFTQVVLYRRLIERLRERLVLMIGMIVFMGSTTAIGLVKDPLFFIPVIAFYAFGLATTDPSLQALVTRFGKAEQQGYLLGLYQSISSMATIAGPVWAGWVYEHVGPAATYLTGGAIIAAGVFFAAMLLREQIPAPADDQHPLKSF